MSQEKDGNIQKELTKAQGNGTKENALVGAGDFSELRYRLEEIQSIIRVNNPRQLHHRKTSEPGPQPH